MISFIIPTKNEEKVLERTLQALTAYTGEKEIILSDGNSTDRTLEIARKYCDKVIVYEGAVRQNISQGRNAGGNAATGDYLIFIDADVVIPNIDTFCATLLEQFKKRPNLTGITVNIRVLPELETLMDRIVFHYVSPKIIGLQNNILHTGAASGEFQMMPREAFKALGGYDETLIATEDMDMFWRLAKIGRTMLYSKLTAYHTGRRAHTIGWHKLLWQWLVNWLSALFLRRSVSEEWVEIR